MGSRIEDSIIAYNVARNNAGGSCWIACSNSRPPIMMKVKLVVFMLVTGNGSKAVFDDVTITGNRAGGDRGVGFSRLMHGA